MEKNFDLETCKYIYYNSYGYPTTYYTKRLYVKQCWIREVEGKSLQHWSEFFAAYRNSVGSRISEH